MNEAQLGYCVRIEVYTRTAYKDSLSSQLQRKPLLIKGSGNIFQALCTCILFVMRFINCFGHTSICESIKIKNKKRQYWQYSSCMDNRLSFAPINAETILSRSNSSERRNTTMEYLRMFVAHITNQSF